MKLAMLLSLLMISTSSFAFFKRISKLDCADKGNSIHMLYDSNFSIFVAKDFKINGKDLGRVMEKVEDNSHTYFGKTVNGNAFSFQIPRDKKEFKSVLSIGDQKRTLDCKISWKLRVDWFDKKDSGSILDDSRVSGKELRRAPAIPSESSARVVKR